MNDNEQINHLTAVLESNLALDAENIIERFKNLRKEHKILKKSYKDDMGMLKVKLDRVRAERDEALTKMKSQAETVTTPLIKQVMERDAEIARLKKRDIEISFNLKMLHSILRSPVLSNNYQKEVRKIMTEQQITNHQNKARQLLIDSNVSGQNENKFIQNLALTVESQLLNGSVSPPLLLHQSQQSNSLMRKSMVVTSEPLCLSDSSEMKGKFSLIKGGELG